MSRVIDADHPRPYRRYIHSAELWGTAFTGTLFVTGRVYVAPIQIPVTLTIDRLGWIQDNVSAGNVRNGLYRDMGDTPVGGALVVESASIAKAGTLRKMEAVIVDTQLSPGLYWRAIRSDENTSTFAAHGVSYPLGGSLLGGYYDAAYGAFTNPFPAITPNNNAPGQYVRVRSIP